MAQTQQYSQEDFSSDLNIKMRNMEEKQEIIKDRIMLIGENLLSEKEENEKEIEKLKEKITTLTDDLSLIKSEMAQLKEMLNNTSKKTEVDILRKQFKMFEPLEIARLKDIPVIVEEILKRKVIK